MEIKKKKREKTKKEEQKMRIWIERKYRKWQLWRYIYRKMDKNGQIRANNKNKQKQWQKKRGKNNEDGAKNKKKNKEKK